MFLASLLLLSYDAEKLRVDVSVSNLEGAFLALNQCAANNIKSTLDENQCSVEELELSKGSNLLKLVKKDAKQIPWETPPIAGKISEVSLVDTDESIVIKRIFGDGKGRLHTEYYEADKSLNSFVRLSDYAVKGISKFPKSCHSSTFPLNHIDWLPCNLGSKNILSRDITFEVERKFSDRLTYEGDRYRPDYYVNILRNHTKIDQVIILKGGQSTNGPSIKEFHVNKNALYFLVNNNYGPNHWDSWVIQHYQIK